ncbi:MAG: hypothetical protein SCL54_10565 [Bacillota bacterium]|nr:hypothetical protein [Bacillota bacterium]
MNMLFLSDIEFIEFAAHDCLNQLSEISKDRLNENPDPILNHFGLGMFIRNNYIYGNNSIRFEVNSPDDLSSKIIDRMMAILSDE